MHCSNSIAALCHTAGEETAPSIYQMSDRNEFFQYDENGSDQECIIRVHPIHKFIAPMQCQLPIVYFSV